MADTIRCSLSLRTASSQVPCRSFSYKHEKSLTSLLFLFPKSLTTFREPYNEFYSVQRHLKNLSLPSEKKSYVPPPPPSWICFLLIFGQTKKPLHGITNGRRYFFSFHFAMLCNGFEIQACLCNFQSSKSLVGILEYHTGYVAVKILGKFFSMPCGQDFYSLILKLGERFLTSHPIAHRKV